MYGVFFNKRGLEIDLILCSFAEDLSAKEVIEKEDQEERSLQELTAGQRFYSFCSTRIYEVDSSEVTIFQQFP